jgi:hypothetical protein
MERPSFIFANKIDRKASVCAANVKRLRKQTEIPIVDGSALKSMNIDKLVRAVGKMIQEVNEQQKEHMQLASSQTADEPIFKSDHEDATQQIEKDESVDVSRKESEPAEPVTLQSQPEDSGLATTTPTSTRKAARTTKSRQLSPKKSKPRKPSKTAIPSKKPARRTKPSDEKPKK